MDERADSDVDSKETSAYHVCPLRIASWGVHGEILLRRVKKDAS